MPFQKTDLKQMIENEKKRDPEFAEQWEKNKSKREVIRQLVKCRKKAGLSQSELAQKAGIKQQALSRIEQRVANPTLSTLCAITDALEYELTLKPANEEIVNYKTDYDNSGDIIIWTVFKNDPYKLQEVV